MAAPDNQHLEDELFAISSIEDETTRVQALLDLAPTLPESLFDYALHQLGRITDLNQMIRGLAGIAPYLTESQLVTAIDFASFVSQPGPRNHALGALSSRLPEEPRNNVIQKVHKLTPTAADRLPAWLHLAPYLPGELKQEAISTALSLSNDAERTDALIALAPHVADVWKIKALESAREISDPLLKVKALAGLIAAPLPKKDRAKAQEEALTLAREITSPFIKAGALLILQPQMPSTVQTDVSHEIAGLIDAVDDLQQRLTLYIRLADSLPAEHRAGYLKVTALADLASARDDKLLGEAVITLAGSSPPELYQDILSASARISDPQIKSSVAIQLQSIIDLENLPTTSSWGERLPPPPSGSSDARSDVIQDFPTSDAPEIERPRIGPSDFDGVFHDMAPSSGESPDTAPPELPPVKPKATKAKAPRKKAPKVEPAVIEEPIAEPSPDESLGVKAYLHSDKWTLDDQLNYSLYADAIAEFMLHPDTKAPLAIGILAPWGQGKTTLMRLIQDELEKKTKAPQPPEPPTQGAQGSGPKGVVVPPIKTRFRFGDLRTWLQDPITYKLETEKLSYPTVWFNAWKYQNSEQLWAGMAYAILSQLVSKISSQYEREKFWLALQAERIDFNEVRRDIHRMVFERIMPWLAVSVAVAVIGLLVFLIGFFAGNILLGSGGGVVLLTGVALPIVKWLHARTKVDSKPLEGKFAQYVRQPTYEGKLGFFHEIEMDVQRVFRLLVAEGKPVVIFIDDLDRCSPGTVAQVIEAMNLFLSADFPDCYFVVGMDAQVVAASMEVAYEDLDKKLQGVTRSYGSLGWYFMDKFIQLQFSIPNMTPAQRSVYITKLFGREAAKEVLMPADELDNVEKKLEQNLNSAELKPEQLPQQAVELSKLRLQRPDAWHKLSRTLIKTSAQKLSDDSPTLQKYLERYEPFLGVSPRGIKRFANLYRFYSLSQLSRQSQGLQASSPGALARWLVIMLRWPQVVRWIQWESEAKLGGGSSALSKAEALEEQLIKTTTHADWLAYLEKLDPNHAAWLADKQLYEFLKTAARSDEKLSIAVKTGVW